ncbi:hypothetical protein A2422_03780 [Candidatus Woesebacteria bacterium RIFOXYC1_FULL_31_51]|nr:MAG: hypothetical protein A2422_03780 [Candidatus Woesebacteria bacterium RIFOXYC1_FULL_31_51]OGM86246.1 MAG: hypothetical protein A2595_01845 [Candidatus Woesebacteria bacterium RIFOXYD1_FULL_31_53]
MNKDMKKKDSAKLSKFLMIGALLGVMFSFIGYFGLDIWLASTQWLLVSAVMALFGVYLKLT